jgi:D-aminopeptidase
MFANGINASQAVRDIKVLGNDAMSPLFQAVIEATEEAIINSLLKDESLNCAVVVA